MFTFVVSGPPRTKKTSQRMVHIGRGRAVTKILPSKAFEQWHASAMLEAFAIKSMLRSHGAQLPICDSINVRAFFYRDALRGDSAGFYQALGDWMQDSGIIVNDKQIASWNGSLLLKDSSRPRIEVAIDVLCTER